MTKQYYLYILTNKKDGVLYIGMTNDLVKRVCQHKEGLVEGFTRKYRTNRLVYFESSTEVKEVIFREKQIKKWNRAWKIELIESINPSWNDLYEKLIK